MGSEIRDWIDIWDLRFRAAQVATRISPTLRTSSRLCAAMLMARSVSSEVMHMQNTLYQARQLRHVKCSSFTDVPQIPCTGIRLKHCATVSTTRGKQGTHTAYWALMRCFKRVLTWRNRLVKAVVLQETVASFVTSLFCCNKKWRRFVYGFIVCCTVSYPAIRNYDIAIALAIFRRGASVVSAAVVAVDAIEVFPCASTTWLSHSNATQVVPVIQIYPATITTNRLEWKSIDCYRILALSVP